MQLTKKEFLEQFKSNKINVNLSVNYMDEFGLADNFGTRHKLTSSEAFLAELEKITKEDLSGYCYINSKWTKETLVVESEEIPSVNEAVSEEVVTIVPEEVEVLSEALVEPATDIEKVVTEVNWAWVEGLNSIKSDKLKLDQYAEENFGIKLKRSKTLKGMIKDFKEALGVTE